MLNKEQLLEICQKANDFARSKIIHSSTTPDLNWLQLSREKKLLLAKAIEIDLREDSFLIDDTGLSTRESVAIRLFRRFKFSTSKPYEEFKGIGNCFEYALAAYLYIKKHFGDFLKNIPMEIMKVGKDHIILVVGRNPKATLDNIDNWDTDNQPAIICDPLLNSVFYAKDWRGNLKEYKGEDKEKGNIYEAVTNTKSLFQIDKLFDEKYFTYADIVKVKIKAILSELFKSEQGKITALPNLFKIIDACATLDEIKNKGIPELIKKLYPPHVEDYEVVAKVMRENLSERLNKMLSHVNDGQFEEKKSQFRK